MSWERNFTKWIGSRSSVVFHTIFFIVMFSLIFLGFRTESILLILTTVVSLEAIYLAIFIQMTVNQNTESLEEVEEDIDEIQHDVDEIQQDVDEIEKETDIFEGTTRFDQEKIKNIETVLKRLLDEIENLKSKK